MPKAYGWYEAAKDVFDYGAPYLVNGTRDYLKRRIHNAGQYYQSNPGARGVPLLHANGTYVKPDPGGKMMKIKRFGGATTGRLGGFVKSKARVPSFQKRKAKKGKRKSFKPAQVKGGKNGVVLHKEQSGTTISSSCSMIGHTSMPFYIVRYLAWLAVLKRLFAKAQLPITSIDQPITFADVNTDGIRITYLEHATGAPVFLFFNIATIGVTIEAMAKYLRDPARVFNSSDNTTLVNQRVFESISLTMSNTAAGSNFIGPAKLMLTDSYVTLTCKSAMKVQNRTVEATGDDETDVNNCPLEGLTYSGRGTGALWKKENNQVNNFLADQTTGMIYTEDNLITKPPGYLEFKNVRRGGKVRITPGHIKTSVLTDTVTKNFSKLMAVGMPFGEGTSVNMSNGLGKYRMFSLEKVIDTTGSGQVTTAYELQAKFTADLTVKSSNVTCMSIENAYTNF